MSSTRSEPVENRFDFAAFNPLAIIRAIAMQKIDDRKFLTGPGCIGVWKIKTICERSLKRAALKLHAGVHLPGLG